MSEFGFIFSLYSLLLSFSLVELLSGLGRCVEETLHPRDSDDKQFRLGLLTPLLGIFVLLDLLSFWSAAWTTRDLLEVNGVTLMSVLVFASSYFLAAYMVFPSQPAKHENLDDHYFRVRRIVIGILLVLVVCQLGFYWAQPELAARLNNPLALSLTAILIILMLATMLFRSVKLNVVILVALIARYLIVYAI
ncbi:hypothetical protein [Sphingorhabdus sp. Alg239-R122]|uniref:hypothetical protein n=1 Tax=Sphingorhabdus sp. Alg239-R122 TaxID=2305989 RepID=UPI0013DA46F8|nr:hypothetical protein [Sphingorhabdus sp. Alg239-R122]